MYFQSFETFAINQKVIRVAQNSPKGVHSLSIHLLKKCTLISYPPGCLQKMRLLNNLKAAITN